MGLGRAGGVGGAAVVTTRGVRCARLGSRPATLALRTGARVAVRGEHAVVGRVPSAPLSASCLLRMTGQCRTLAAFAPQAGGRARAGGESTFFWPIA